MRLRVLGFLDDVRYAIRLLRRASDVDPVVALREG